jgi:hypothetical protein
LIKIGGYIRKVIKMLLGDDDSLEACKTKRDMVLVKENTEMPECLTITEADTQLFCGILSRILPLIRRSSPCCW